MPGTLKASAASTMAPKILSGVGLDVPDAGEVGFAVGGAGCRGGEIGFAVGRAGRSWRGIVQPLRVSASG